MQDGNSRRVDIFDVLLEKSSWVERFECARRGTHGHNRALEVDHIKVFLEPITRHRLDQETLYILQSGAMNLRVLTDTVIYDVHALAVCELQHAGNNILVLVKDDVIRTMCLRYRRFFLSACRANDNRPEVLDDLRKPQAETACDGVNENIVAGLDVIRLRSERDGGHALRESCGTLARGDIGWEEHGVGPVWSNVLRKRAGDKLE